MGAAVLDIRGFYGRHDTMAMLGKLFGKFSNVLDTSVLEWIV